MLHAFIYGITLAIGLIIPLGMQNVFIFNQGATQPRLILALPSVLAAFLCDVLLILCAVFGISLIILTIPWLKNIFFCVGIVFLCYMGFSTWKSHSRTAIENVPLSLKGQIGFATSVSLFNPHALLDTIGVIGMNSLYFSGYNKFAYTVACMSVSLIWFLGLSIAGHCLNRFDKNGYGVFLINKISALIIWTMACYFTWQLISNL